MRNNLLCLLTSTILSGCGSISPDLATSITNYLYERGRISAVGASAFQIRWGGCKGKAFEHFAYRSLGL